MRRTRMIPLGIVLLALIPGFGAGQSGHDLLQRALQQERIFGNLQEAIQLYQRIALEHAQERALAATALLNLGGACEKLGMPEAQDAYQRVLEEYPDQEGQASEARSRLEALTGSTAAGAAGSGGQGPTYTLLLDEGPGNSPLFARKYDLSPDGRQLVFLSRRLGPSGVYLTERLGDRPRLIRELRYHGRFGMPRWSPDGSMIAVQNRDDDGWHALIIDPAGNLIARVPYSAMPTETAWNPDQKGLTYTPRSSELGGVRSVTFDGEETVLAETTGSVFTFAGYSPDGRWVAIGWYGLRVFPAGGGTPRQIARSVTAPVWGPDGALYWVSRVSGNRNVWRIGFDTQSGEAIGEPEQVTFYRDADVQSIAVAREAGNVAFILARQRSTIWTAPAAGIDEPRGLVRGFNPMLSPDGTQVFFTGEGPGNDGVFAVPTAGGTPRRLTPESHSVRTGSMSSSSLTFLWPDGLHVGYQAIVRVDTTGAPRPQPEYFVIATEGGNPEQLPVPGNAYPPTVSPDGTMLAYALPESDPDSGVEDHKLFLVPVEGGEPTLRAILPVYQAKWSPDKRYLAAIHPDDASGTLEVRVLPVEEGEPRLLVATKDPEWIGTEVSWHPDSDRLSYPYKDTIWVATIDGRPPTPFHFEPELENWGGRWAPDGETFFSEGFGPGGWDTYRRNPDGTSELLWVRGEIPSTSADGETWAWVTHTSSLELWMLEDYR